MKRPSDQAKFLFLALLRGTVSALATTDSKAAGMVKNCVAGSSPASSFLTSAHIQLRLARRADISSIQQCNLATLPENYNSQFYNSHLRQWPDLALVAEYVTPAPSPERINNDLNINKRKKKNSLKQHQRINDRSLGMAAASSSVPELFTSTFAPLAGNSNNNNNRSEPHVIAYVLGKIQEDEGCFSTTHEISCFNRDDSAYDDGPCLLGHVTSLAVLPSYRRNGLAAALMNQLHFHLQKCYGVNSVGLHVRKTNAAACSLYENFGYQVDRIIHGYYQDGEDAYFMKKTFGTAKANKDTDVLTTSTDSGEETNTSYLPKFSFLGRKPRPWENAPTPELQLPRNIPISSEEHENTIIDDATEASTLHDDETPELLTGTM